MAMNVRHLRVACHVTCVVCLLASAGVAYWVIGEPVRLEPAVDQATLAVANVTPASHEAIAHGQLPTLSAFEHAWQLQLRRPLFDPPPVKVEAKVFVPPPLAYRLTGTVLNPDGAMAMFVGPQGKIEIRRVGQQIGEATILDISQDRVRINYHDQTRELELAAPQSSGRR